MSSGVVVRFSTFALSDETFSAVGFCSLHPAINNPTVKSAMMVTNPYHFIPGLLRIFIFVANGI
jgi:hypothetical protein